MTDTKQTMTNATLPAALAAFVDQLLPGKGDWPSGATLGIQHPLMERLVTQSGETALEGLSQLLEKIGAPFNGLDADARAAAVRRLETEEPDRFQWLQTAAYQAYYENPTVVALIDARGMPYKLRPHVQGYNLPKFDLETQTPKHGRGHWTRTADVKPVDTSGLNLETETTKWGLQR